MKLSRNSAFRAALILCFSSFQSNATDFNDWKMWLTSKVKANPDVIAVSESVNEKQALLSDNSLALYNPDISADYAKEGSFRNYLITLSQTIDLWGKQSENRQQALLEKVVAEQQAAAFYQKRLAESLNALVEWEQANRANAIAEAEKVRLQRLATAYEEQLHKGEASRVNADLSIFNLSSRLNALAGTELRVIQARAKLDELLPGWQITEPAIPQEFWQFSAQTLSAPDMNMLARLNPSVRVAEANWQLSRQRIKAISKNAKADPTVGINAGKNTGDNVIGLSVSIPLTIRNDHSGMINAANSVAISAEARYQSALNNQVISLQAQKSSVLLYQKYVNDWHELMAGRAERSLDDLTQLLHSGDLSLTDYLTALQQRSDALLSGLDLESQAKTSQIAWLQESGKLTSLLSAHIAEAQ